MTETAQSEAAQSEAAQSEERLNEQIMDGLAELLRHLAGLGQQIGAQYGLSGSDAMALHKLEHPISMKEFAGLLGCDASFVTVLTDSMEKHGLARREPSQIDRRRKNIVLTDHGIAVKDQLMRDVAQRMPWGNALDIGERQAFLRMLRKMLAAAKGGETPAVTSAVPHSS